MIIVAYYTEGNGYKDEADKLIESLLKFKGRDFTLDIEAVKDFCSWDKNTGYKPTFIKRKLQEYKKPIVYLDVDAVVREYPSLFDEIDCDIACHYRDNEELLSGTLYFNYTDKALSVLDEWIKTIGSLDLEQRCLQYVLDQRKDVRVHKLPASYTQIFDSMAHNGKPVIEHFQASRRLRKWQ